MPRQDWFTVNGLKPAQAEEPKPDWFASQGPQSSATEPKPAPPSGNTLVELATGGLKSLGEIAMSPARLASWLAEGSGHPLPPNVDAAIDRGTAMMQPTNTAQTIGKLGGDIAVSFLPMGMINKAARAAGVTTEQALLKLAQNSPNVARAGNIGAQAATQGAAQAGLAEMQGGDPTTAGVMGALVPGARPMSGPLERGAERSMVKALGEAGARGPSGKVALEEAREIAPALLDQKFGALTQRGALGKAETQLKDATSALDLVWNHFLQPGSKASNAGTDMLAELQGARAKLRQMSADGKPFLATGSETTDALYAALEEDIRRLGPHPDMRQLRQLRQNWDEQLNYARADPASGPRKGVFKAGSDLVRATINGSSSDIAVANDAYTLAEKLYRVLESSTARPGYSAVEKLTRAGINGGGAAGLGALAGGYSGGWEGAAQGAIGGLVIGNMVSSPGWRYVSANLKKMLADSLDAGDQKKVSQIATTIASQLVSLNKAGQ